MSSFLTKKNEKIIIKAICEWVHSYNQEQTHEFHLKPQISLNVSRKRQIEWLPKVVILIVLLRFKCLELVTIVNRVTQNK